MPTTTTHPDPHTLAAFARGSLPPAEIAVVAEHVAVCGTCCAALSRVPDDTLVGLAKQAACPTPEVSLPSFPVPIADNEPVPAELADHPRYKVLAELGAGGMGVVYKAEHKMMGRVVALKVMAPHLTAKASAVDRFHREVKAAAKLMHPNIVTAHDADSAGGLHFLVMEYVDGVSLDRLVRRRGPLALTMAAQLARQVALGLQHAHEKDMVHRDIKPQNLMVSRKGQVKILDFGLARFARDTEADGVKPQVTAANLLMGTPEYLSPEQAKNSHNVDSRSDIYSLGCTLYFLLTARVPFPDATTLIDKLLAHTQEEPTAVRAIRPEVPEGLAAVVAKMMAKNPADRFDTPADAAAALLPFTKEADPAALPVTLPLAVPIRPAETLNPFELDTEPEARALTKPATPPEQRRPKPRRAKMAAPAGMSKGVKRLIGVGVAAVALLVVAGIASSGKKANPPPAVPTTDGGGTATRTEGGGKVAVVGTGAAKKKVLFIVPANGVWLPDYVPVRRDMEAGGVEIVVASNAQFARPHKETPGRDVPVDRMFHQLRSADEFAGVMLCGGNVGELFAHQGPGPVVRTIVSDFNKAGKPVGGICLGIQVLAHHGVIGTRRAATPVQRFYGFENLNWQPQGVTTDGNLVTASGPEHAPAFAQAMLKAIGAK